MNEVMAEVVQLSSWKTKAINLRAAASNCKDTEAGGAMSCCACRAFLQSLQPAGVKTGRGFFTVRADAAKGKTPENPV